MEWSEILADPSLQDLPYKIETDEYGNIVMSPASNHHSRRQSQIERDLESCLKKGEVFVECSIGTPKGTKVPDVVWASDELMARQDEADPMTEAPEICIEVLSPSNSRKEIDLKRWLYFEVGAKEVWVCDSKGKVTFYDEEGVCEQSKIAPTFPSVVPLGRRRE